MSQEKYCLSSLCVIGGGILFMNGVLSFSPELTFFGILGISFGSYLTLQIIQPTQTYD